MTEPAELIAQRLASVYKGKGFPDYGGGVERRARPHLSY
jgi:hypothetical protein